MMYRANQAIDIAFVSRDKMKSNCRREAENSLNDKASKIVSTKTFTENVDYRDLTKSSGVCVQAKTYSPQRQIMMSSQLFKNTVIGISDINLPNSSGSGVMLKDSSSETCYNLNLMF